MNLIDIISPTIETVTKKGGKTVPFTKSLLKSQSKARGIEQIDDVIKFQNKLLMKYLN